VVLVLLPYILNYPLSMVDAVRFLTWSAKILFVNCLEKPYFRVSSPSYVHKDGSLTVQPLLKETAWKIDPAIYGEFEILVQKYLAPTLLAPK